MATGYLEILRARHALRLLTGTLVGRLPNATAAIALVLFVRASGGTYSLAGALAAVYGVANAVGQPVLGGWWICTGSRGCSCPRRCWRRCR